MKVVVNKKREFSVQISGLINDFSLISLFTKYNTHSTSSLDSTMQQQYIEDSERDAIFQHLKTHPDNKVNLETLDFV